MNFHHGLRCIEQNHYLLFYRNADKSKELTYCVSLFTYCVYHLISIFGALYSLKEAGIFNVIVNNVFCAEALEMVRDITSSYSELMIKCVALRKFCCKGEIFGTAATILYNYLLPVQ